MAQNKPIDPAAPADFKSEYEVTNLMYPNDLMGSTNQYNGNYVIFYVNVHEDSYLIKNKNVPTVNGRAAPRVQSYAKGLSAGGVTGSAVVAGGIVGGASGPVGGAASALGIDLVTKAASVADVALGGLVGAAAVAAVGGAKSEYKQLKSAIALHMPTELMTRYSASWDADSLAGSMAIAAGVGTENMDKALQNMPPGSDNRTSAAEAARGYLAGKALQTPGGGQLLSKSSGVATNPKKEQMFQEVDFRTFTFNYQFFPRSSTEASNVLNIIKMFKLHMHPEYKPGTGQFLYIYPSEFDIVYYQNGVENTKIHRHTTSVLTELQVNYTPQGTFSAFADGMPTQINMTMTFKELAQLTKETIDTGY